MNSDEFDWLSIMLKYPQTLTGCVFSTVNMDHQRLLARGTSGKRRFIKKKVIHGSIIIHMQTCLKYKKNTTCVFVHNIYLWKVNCTQLGTMDGWHCHKMAISCQIHFPFFFVLFFRNNNGKIKIWVMSLKSLICVSFMLLSDVLTGRTV